MIWNPPFNPTITTLLVLLVGGAIVASYFLARHRLRLNSAEAIAIMLLRGLAFLLVLYLLLQPAALPEPRKIETRRTFAVLLDASGSMTGPATGADDEADNRLDDARRLLREHRVFAQVTDQAKLAVYTFTDQVRPTAPGAIDAVEAQIGRASCRERV